MNEWMKSIHRENKNVEKNLSLSSPKVFCVVGLLMLDKRLADSIMCIYV